MRRKLSCWLVLCSSIVCSKAVHAQSWQALSGAESPDHAVQVIAFLPNEMWIHKDDTITWSFPTPEPHSVTFLTPGQVRPTFTVGCPGTTPDGAEPRIRSNGRRPRGFMGRFDPFGAGKGSGWVIKPGVSTDKVIALKDFAGQKAVVVVFIGTECPVSNAYMVRLGELHKQYAAKGVAFVAVNANCHETPAQKPQLWSW